ncbi:MAG: DUF3592 domain-containing protein [Myxococcota bacterium]|nr:DUF3592 domain-containing protein [Myxococcota bacterium]
MSRTPGARRREDRPTSGSPDRSLWQPRPMPIAPLVVSSLFMLAGAGLAVLGLRVRRSIASFNARAITAEGVVVGSTPRRVEIGSTPTTIHFPHVEITTRDGRRVTVDGPGERTAPAPGERRALLYDPQAPTEVSFSGPRGQARMPEMLVGGGAVLVLSGIGFLALALAR